MFGGCIRVAFPLRGVALTSFVKTGFTFSYCPTVFGFLGWALFTRDSHNAFFYFSCTFTLLRLSLLCSLVWGFCAPMFTGQGTRYFLMDSIGCEIIVYHVHS